MPPHTLVFFNFPYIRLLGHAKNYNKNFSIYEVLTMSKDYFGNSAACFQKISTLIVKYVF